MTLDPPHTSGAAPVAGEPRHGRRILGIWLVLSIIAEVLFITVAGPHIPPGTASNTAASQQTDTIVLVAVAIPVVLLVIVYGIYALVVWRAPRDRVAGASIEETDGPPIRTHLPIQFGWIGLSSLIVFSLFVYGTVELIRPAGAGGGEGPAPIWTPKTHNVLAIQVIGQQWKWTYRYPSYGGFESDRLVVPANTEVAFHVTSLDVIHDFWAYELGVKADANPGVDNIAFTQPQQLGRFVVRCDELCGLWHGAMFTYGQVMTKSAFSAWAHKTEATLAPETKLLPTFAWIYVPDANGADGSYYDDSVDPYTNQERYPAKPSSTHKGA